MPRRRIFIFDGHSSRAGNERPGRRAILSRFTDARQPIFHATNTHHFRAFDFERYHGPFIPVIICFATPPDISLSSRYAPRLAAIHYRPDFAPGRICCRPLTCISWHLRDFIFPLCVSAILQHITTLMRYVRQAGPKNTIYPQLILNFDLFLLPRI